MGFFTGRVSFLRYQVDGPAPTLFGPEHLELLAKQAIGKQAIAEKDGTEAGWIASDDILDLGFDLAKNVVDDTLHFCLRVDTQKLPADLLRSYVRTELQALASQNPSGKPTVKQKKEAREAAREKLTGPRPRMDGSCAARRIRCCGTGRRTACWLGARQAACSIASTTCSRTRSAAS